MSNQTKRLTAAQLREKAEAVPKGNGALPELLWIEVGPELAHELLSRNPHNRNLKRKRVEQWTGAMRRGEWRTAGQSPIVLTRNGDLDDGQNRLTAVIESGKTLVFPAMLGTDHRFADQETRDQGAARTLGDVLRLRKETNANALGAALRASWAYDHRGTMAAKARSEPTTAQLLKYLRANPDIRESVIPGMRLREALGTGFPGTAMIAIHYAATFVDRELADLFFAQLASGEGLDKGSPILVCRNHLTRGGPVPNERLHVLRRLAWTIKAWNLWNAGEQATKLNWTPAKEPFPQIIGGEPRHLKESR